ncbi:hypothetical protein Bbelb_407690 [Branchiostoma belcheri]|nr:hypothetical protein Bbelb_429310 [Branchiostoma belcheri]KAI8481476.1 hypothetical protein Bbelb_407690 [Branchiostoma belcheri]
MPLAMSTFCRSATCENSEEDTPCSRGNSDLVEAVSVDNTICSRTGETVTSNYYEGYDGRSQLSSPSWKGTSVWNRALHDRQDSIGLTRKMMETTPLERGVRGHYAETYEVAILSQEAL